jgi:hypothetical protein
LHAWEAIPAEILVNDRISSRRQYEKLTNHASRVSLLPNKQSKTKEEIKMDSSSTPEVKQT